jgi:hypothetical protein
VAEQLGQPLLALQLLQLSRSCEVNREQDRHATASSGAGASAPLQLAANLDQLHLCKLAAAAVLAVNLLPLVASDLILLNKHHSPIPCASSFATEVAICECWRSHRAVTPCRSAFTAFA